MWKLVMLVLVVVGSVRGGTLEGCFVAELTASAVRFACTAVDNVGDGSNTVLASGADSGFLDHDAGLPSASSVDGLHVFSFYDSPASTEWFYSIGFAGTSYTCPVVCTDCDSSDDPMFGDTNTARNKAGTLILNGGVGSGIQCANVGHPLKIVHPAAEDPEPIAPVHSRTPDEVYGQFDGVGETCTTTSGVDPATWTSTYTSVSNNGDCQIIKVTGAITLESLTTLASHTSDIVVLMKDTALLPTYRARVGPEHEASLLVIEPEHPSEHEQWATVSSLSLPDNFICYLCYVRDPAKPVAPRQYAVSSVTTATRVVVLSGGVCPEDHSSGFKWYSIRLPGVSGHLGVDTASCSGGTLTFGNGSWSGTYTSGGVITQGQTLLVASVGAANPAVVNFSHAHGLPLESETSRDFVYVGNVRGTGCSGVNGVHDYTVVDTDSIELVGVNASGCTPTVDDWTFARYGGGYRGSYLNATQKTNVWCLQCVLGEVWYGQKNATSHFNLYEANESGFMDGTIMGGGHGALLDPGTGLPVYVVQTGTVRGAGFGVFGCRDCQFRNINVLGVRATATFNFQQNARVPEDITIEAVTDTNLRRGFAGPNFPTSLGLHNYDPRQCIEFKNGIRRGRVTGYECLGGALGTEFNSSGYAMFIATTPDSTPGEIIETKDLTIEYSLIKGFASGISFGLQQNFGGATRHGLTDRVTLRENVFAGVMNTSITMVPPQNASTTPLLASAGYGFSTRVGMSDFRVLHNTILSQEGASVTACRGFGYDGWRAPNAIVAYNVFPFHCSTTNGIAVFDSSPGFLPHTGTSSATRFASWAPYGDCLDNLFYQGIENPSNTAAAKSSSADGDTKTSTEWNTAFGSDPCAINGPTDATYAARHAALFPDTFMVSPTYNDCNGETCGITSYAAHLRARGRVIAQKPIQTEEDTLVITLESNTTLKCSARWSENAFTSSQTVTQAASTGFSQTITITGITPLATLAISVECPGGETTYWPSITLQ